MTLSDIKTSHPLVYKHFSKIENSELHLNRLTELDSYWNSNASKEIPHVIHESSKLPANITISGEFDLIYCGATLGLLHAAAMTFLHGKSVLIIDKHTPAKTHRDWNISLRELARLEKMNLFPLVETEKAITQKYKTGFVEFASRENRKRLFIDGVLDCAIDSDIILNLALDKINANPKNKILEKTLFKQCFKLNDGIIVEVEKNGKLVYYKAKVLVDTMGVMSPIARELNNGVPQTHCCPTVGTLASGLENIDYSIGEILVSTEPAEISNGTGRQLIWEGFPASETTFTSYLFFYDNVKSKNDKSLLNLFEVYFEKLPTYKNPSTKFYIEKPVYGIIPAYHHDGFRKSRVTANDRIILFGDAASLSSPLTFCGFGSMVRNLERTTENLADALNNNSLTKSDLEKVSAYEPNVAIMSNLMKFMCYNAQTDEPNFVNELMNEIMMVLDQLPTRYRETMFRDEMSIGDFTSLILTVGRKYPKIFEIAYRKLGVSGSVSWLQNWTGWAVSTLQKSK